MYIKFAIDTTMSNELESRVKKLEEKIAQLESGKSKKDKPKVERKPTEYNLFFKKTMATLKSEFPDMSHKERFAECAKRWNAQKA